MKEMFNIDLFLIGNRAKFLKFYMIFTKVNKNQSI